MDHRLGSRGRHFHRPRDDVEVLETVGAVVIDDGHRRTDQQGAAEEQHRHLLLAIEVYHLKNRVPPTLTSRTLRVRPLWGSRFSRRIRPVPRKLSLKL